MKTTKKIIVTTFVLLTMCCGCVLGAEEAVKSIDPWMPVIGEAIALTLKIVGPALVLLVSAVLWKLLGKLGIEKNVAMDALLRTYVKQAVNYADAWAEKQSDKPAGEQKMAAAIKHILGLISESKLPAVAEEKLKEKIEAQLARDRKKIQ